MLEMFMTREETAKTFKVSLRTVDTLIARQELNVRRIGRRVLIPTDEVERFAKGTKHEAGDFAPDGPLAPTPTAA